AERWRSGSAERRWPSRSAMAIQLSEQIAEEQGKARQHSAAVQGLGFIQNSCLLGCSVHRDGPGIRIDLPDQGHPRVEILAALPGHFSRSIAIAENFDGQVRCQLRNRF